MNITPLGFPWQTQDPFLFCAYHRDEYPQGNGKMEPEAARLQGRNIGQDFTIKEGWRMYHGSRIPGFPYHPHRGFETVTINKEGVVDHSDSLGAAGRFMDGDVQWMTAGSGVQHSEMFPLINDHKGNALEIFQIWLNLPRASKLVAPHFKMLWREDIPVMEHLDDAGKKTIAEVIAGKLEEVQAPESTPNSWAANRANAVGIFTAKMQAGAKWILPKTDAKAGRSIYFYKGDSIQIEGQNVRSNHLIEAIAGSDIFIQNGSEEAFFLILEGKPIKEPVVQHGPFVMNTQDEIRETMKEYGRTQFGGWPWPLREMVHSKDKGRFAKHGDGSKEVK